MAAQNLVGDAIAANELHWTQIHEIQVASLRQEINALDKLTDAKFVTFRALLEGNAEKVALALAAADKAVTKAEIAVEKRFDGVNEFRGSLDDALKSAAAAAANFVTREMLDDRLAAIDREHNARNEAILQRLGTIDKALANTAGRIAVGGAVVTFILSLVVVAANALFK